MEYEESEYDIFSDNFSVVFNGSFFIKGLYFGKDKSCGVGYFVFVLVIIYILGLLNNFVFFNIS